MTLKTKTCFFLHFWIQLTSSKNISENFGQKISNLFSEILYTVHFTTEISTQSCKVYSVQNLKFLTKIFEIFLKEVN
jgi:hypothetical protein